MVSGRKAQGIRSLTSEVLRLDSVDAGKSFQVQQDSVRARYLNARFPYPAYPLAIKLHKKGFRLQEGINMRSGGTGQ